MLGACLKEILDGKVLVSSKPGGGMPLKQRNVMEVEVLDMSPDAAVVNLQRIGSLSGLRGGPWNQRCDYLLIDRDGSRERVLFVELKKSLTEDRTRALEQLRRSLPIWQYLRSICEIHSGAEAAGAETSVQFALIGKKLGQRLDKQHVKSPPQVSVESHRDISVTTFVGSRISFDRLCKG